MGKKKHKSLKRVFYDKRKNCWKNWNEAGITEKIRGLLSFQGIVILRDGIDSVDLPRALEETNKEGWREEEIIVLDYINGKYGIAVERAVFERRSQSPPNKLRGLHREEQGQLVDQEAFMEEEKQQLGRRNTYTPAGAAPARGNCDPALNREETLSVPDSKTLPNNSEEHEHSSKSGQDLRVPVLNMRGEPLMPTTPRKARKLLEQGKAKVVSRTPFVIQLLYPTGEAKQDITLGIDAGYKTIGYSAVTATEELIKGELELRTDIPRLLEKRRTYRRARRSRKWYRKPRFLNRGRHDGWLPPSLEHKLQSHIKLIERLKRILPITKVVVEVASFDTQKMQNPEINGVEYQQGELQGYEVREYLLEKWQRKCAYCGKKNVPLEVEHIIPKSRGGSDRVSNLTLSCHECNQKKGNKTAAEFGHPEVQKQAKESLKMAAFMNNIR